MIKKLSVIHLLVIPFILNAQVEKDTTLNTGLGFSLNYTMMSTATNMLNQDTKEEFNSSVSTPMYVSIGVQYKSWGIKFSTQDMYASKSENTKTDKQAELSKNNSMVRTYYFSEKWGGDYTYSKIGGFTKEYEEIDADGQLWNEDFELKGMEMIQHKAIAYRKLSGKYDLYDNFCSPVASRKSKFGTYALLSIETRKNSGLGNMWRKEPNDIAPLDMNNKHMEFLAGAGANGVWFITERIIISYSLSLALGYKKTKTTISNADDFNKGYFGYEFDGIAYWAYVGQKWSFDVGGIYDIADIKLTDDWYLKQIGLKGVLSIKRRF